jgi:dTDP-4-amino-4,6-dideoxygalactose transaminase
MCDKNKIYLSASHMSGAEQKYIEEAFALNEVSSHGLNITAFENKIASYLGGFNKVVALTSGTAAIHLALILSGVKHGDEVICQSFTFSASANPIMYQGANPVFVDSEQDTWNMCPIQLERAIKNRIANGKKPKAIIAVHVYGMPAKILEILAIAKKYEIKLIEDAAEAFGAMYDNQQCGTFGDFGILSFNGNKIITTSGGGALICKTQEAKTKAIFLATQAKDKAVHYQHSEIGYNYRMSNIAAGIGRGQMEVLDEHIALRQNINFFYREIFSGIEGIIFLSPPNPKFVSNHWLTCILVDHKKTGFSSEDIRSHLAFNNVESRSLWKPMHLQPVYKDCHYFGENTCAKFFEKGLCLPSSSNLTAFEKDCIKGYLKQFA